MKLPPGFESRYAIPNSDKTVFHLNKSIYGLCQSARVFYLHLDALLRQLGWKRLHAEWAIWIAPDKSGFVGCHVDDMLIGATKEIADLVYKHLAADLQITDFGAATIYVGISIVRDRLAKTIAIHQTDYIRKLLTVFDMDHCNPVGTPMAESDRERIVGVHSDPLNSEEKRKYQQLVGCLLFLVHGSRPDIAYAVIRLSQFSSRPELHHWDALKRILRYLKGTIHATLVLGQRSDTYLEGYFDAAYADNGDKRSSGGYVFLFYGSLVSWSSKVQRSIAVSTVEAEFVAASEAGRETMWIRSIAADIHDVVQPVTNLYGDNTGTLALAKNPEFHQRTKHIGVRERYIASLVDQKLIQVIYVPSANMLADSLTKPLAKDRHVLHWEMLGLCLHQVERHGNRKRKRLE